MPSPYHDSNADDRHDRDFDRFRRDEALRFPVVSEREITPEAPKAAEPKEQPEEKDQ